MKNVNVTINEQVMRAASMIADKRNKTIDEILSEMLEHGIKDTCYRMKRNAEKWQQQKATNERIKELEQMLMEKGE